MKNLLSYLIVRSIQKNWDEIALIENGEKHSFKKLALFVIKLSTFLDKLDLDLSTPIALVGKFSFNWLVVYTTCLIKGISILIINPKDSAVNIKWQLIRNNVKILFHDFTSNTKIKPGQIRIPFLKVKISLIDFTHYILSTDTEEFPYYANWAKAIEEFKNTKIDEEWKYDGDNFERLQEDNFDENNFAILQYTSGTSEPSHVVAFSFKKIWQIIENITSTIIRKNVVYFADHTYFHFIMILNKIINGETIIHNKEIWSETVKRNKLEIIGIESHLFRLMWDQYFSFLKEKHYRLLQRWGKCFVNLKLKRTLHKVLGDQVKEMIILNNELPLDILKLFNDAKIKISSTYGTLESGQLLSFNDINSCKSILTAGRPSFLYSFKINSDDPLEIPGELLYCNNKDESGRNWVATGDIGRINKNGEILIFGKKANIIKNKMDMPIFPEYIERRMDMFPGIKKVYIIQWNGKLCGIVEIDTNRFVAEKYTYLKLQNLLDQYTKLINSHAGVYNQINYITPVSMNILPLSLNNKPIRVNFLGNSLQHNFHLLRTNPE